MPTLVTNRIRFDTDLGDKEYVHHAIPYVGTPYDASGFYPSFTYYKSIRDNVNRKYKGFYPQSDVQNVKISSKILSSLPSYHEADTTVVAVKYPPYCTPDSVLALVPSIPDLLWDNFFYDSFIDFSTQVPEEISSYNFLWEGREVAELLPKLEATASATVTGGYLNLEFGWKPFLSDLNKLGNMVSIIQKRLDHLIEINGKTTRLSSTKKNVVSIPYIRPWIDILGNDAWYMRLSSYRADLRCTGRLSVDLVDLKKESAFWRAAAVALGLTNPLKAFWESVPFSFMADWFNRIGSRIFNLTVNPFQGRWEISNLSTSITENAKIDFRWKYRPSFNNEVNIGSFSVARYTRYRGFPAQPSIFNLDVLSPKQQTLMLAIFSPKSF